MIQQLLLLTLFVSSGPSHADPHRLASRSAHYTVFYQVGYEKDVEFTREWLDATEQLMKTKYRGGARWVQRVALPAAGAFRRH